MGLIQTIWDITYWQIHQLLPLLFQLVSNRTNSGIKNFISILFKSDFSFFKMDTYINYLGKNNYFWLYYRGTTIADKNLRWDFIFWLRWKGRRQQVGIPLSYHTSLGRFGQKNKKPDFGHQKLAFSLECSSNIYISRAQSIDYCLFTWNLEARIKGSKLVLCNTWKDKRKSMKEKQSARKLRNRKLNADHLFQLLFTFFKIFVQIIQTWIIRLEKSTAW